MSMLHETSNLNTSHLPDGAQSVSGAQSAIGLSLPFGFGNYAAFC
jgi:hypothetical protein